MKKSGRALTYALWAATVLWMGLCLYLSWQPGKETADVSGWLAQAVNRLIDLFGLEIDMDVLHTFLRRNAHIAIFFVAGVLLSCSLGRSLPQGAHIGRTSFFIAASVCTLLAVVAEVGKLWVPGRHLQWDETLLDVIGALGGAGIAWIVRIWMCRWKHGYRDGSVPTRHTN